MINTDEGFDDMFLPLKFEIRNQTEKIDLFTETFGESENRERRASFALDLTKLNSGGSPGTQTGPVNKNTPI